MILQLNIFTGNPRQFQFQSKTTKFIYFVLLSSSVMTTYCLVAAKDYWGTCRGEYTAKTFTDFLVQYNVISEAKTKQLVGTELTAPRFIQEFQSILTKLHQPNTTVIVVTIGHGNQFVDVDGDESDGMDEGFQLPDGVVLDDTLTRLMNATEIHQTSKLLLISDHCSSGTMLDRKSTKVGQRWISISSSLPNEDSLATGDGNVMLCCLMTYLRSQNLSNLTAIQLKKGLEDEMLNSFAGELQHPIVSVSDDIMWDTFVF